MNESIKKIIKIILLIIILILLYNFTNSIDPNVQKEQFTCDLDKLNIDDLVILNRNPEYINYINQLIDIAEEKGYESLFFKYTFDLVTNFYKDSLDLIIDEIKNYNIIYLDRNGFSDIIINKLKGIDRRRLYNIVDWCEHYYFISNKHLILKFINS